MSPWPSAYTTLTSKQNPNREEYIIIHDAVVVTCDVSTAPGTVVRVTKEGIDVATQENYLRITRLQKAGKRMMGVQEFLRGNTIEAGDMFS
jgi:methionyl-tRNA formyltransferase